LFVHHQCSQLCVACQKRGPSFGTRFKLFLSELYKALSNCGYSLKDRIVRPTKIATPLAYKR